MPATVRIGNGGIIESLSPQISAFQSINDQRGNVIGVAGKSGNLPHCIRRNCPTGIAVGLVLGTQYQSLIKLKASLGIGLV